MSGAVRQDVKIGGHSYSLIFKFGTMRLVEGELDRSLFEVMASGQIGINALSAIFWASLQPKHRMAREASDDLIDAAGVEQVGKWIAEGLAKYFGKSDQAAEDEGNAPAETPGRKRRPKPTS